MNKWWTGIGSAAVVLLAACAIGAEAASRGPTLDIVTNGQAKAVVVVGDETNTELRQNAHLIVEYVEKSTGVTLPFVQESDLSSSGYNGLTQIHIETATAAADPHLASLLAGKPADALVIHGHGKDVIIAGPSEWGVRHGIFEFLERYVDIRWLFPGEDGEDVPQRTELIIPKETVVQQPAFLAREVSPINAAPIYVNERQPLQIWAQRNRLQSGSNRQLQFMHNMYVLFDPQKYGATHPEYYPNGVVPAAGVKNGWQPCYSNPATIAVAASEIIAYFNANPSKPSIALSPNDSGGYCEADPSHPAYPGVRNSIGLLNMSELYYNWVNQVVDQVVLVHPDKKIGVLAYLETMDPPSFPVRPQVVPYLTKDRLSWEDTGVEADGHALVAAWQAKASQIGFYDYQYGNFYLLPRIFPHRMAENMQFAADNDVIGHYIEMYGSLIDGPKAWLSAKLQWDPDQDVDDLLEEWYTRAVGEAAAPSLAAYFAHWEHFWTDRIQASDWFQNSKYATYLPFETADYMTLVTPADLTTSKTLLADVEAKAVTPEQQKRAELFTRAFSYIEDTIVSYPVERETPNGETAALARWNEMAEGIDMRLLRAASRHDKMEQFRNEPSLLMVAVPRMDWTGWPGPDFWQMTDYVKQNEPSGGTVSAAVYGAANATAASNKRSLARLLQKAASGTSAKNPNPSFEAGAASPTGWSSWITSVGTIERSTAIAHTGAASVKVSNMARGGPIQTFAVGAGVTAAQVHYYTPPGTATEGTFQLIMNLIGTNGKTLSALRTEAIPLANTAGQWASLQLLESVPAQIGGTGVNRIQMILLVNGAGYGTDIYLDDAVLYQL
ncbi:DUF4838 domain-containing protein [Paenibacillus oceani]|uniref:DUF4838 domain-containing protein n=1 Tax=Paenibacillus oceani TaxID=2772510 RepID=A0A927H211_9BACL|nr:DUF4838 domain-containing protein [Paenibacillus oceani]MBD2865325.1 DUF4838 domain-containing protein [Paenibacillus oceani]